MLLTWLPAWLSKMQCAPSADRNKAPIAAVLAKYEPFAGSKPASLLEVASGTGQHAAHLAAAFPHVVWQPTEFAGGSAGPESPAYGDLAPVFASIVAHTSGMANVRSPLALDASASPWPAPIESATFDAIFACNVLHISPYAVTEGLLAGAARRLVPGSGLLCVYGPFMVDGEHTSDSNAAFSARLQAQNSAWAVRDATAIAETARAQHLTRTRTRTRTLALALTRTLTRTLTPTLTLTRRAPSTVLSSWRARRCPPTTSCSSSGRRRDVLWCNTCAEYRLRSGEDRSEAGDRRTMAQDCARVGDLLTEHYRTASKL